MKKISEDGYNGIAPHGIILLDKNRTGEQIDGIPVVASAENAVEYLCQNWVDRVIEVCEKEERAAEDILRDCEEMGITVHRALPESFDNGWKKRVENIGGYTVITDSIEPAGPAEAALKRLADIVGGLAVSLPVFYSYLLHLLFILILRDRFSFHRQESEKTEENSKYTSSEVCIWMRKNAKKS